jgi:transposase
MINSNENGGASDPVAYELAAIRNELSELRKLITASSPKEYYSVNEAAKLLDRAPFTVRQWCNNGRIYASKRLLRRGGKLEWVISAAEIARIQSDGLLEP